MALASFTEHGLHYTRDHTGILIVVSLLEHRVEVLADRGINAKVETAVWQEIAKILIEGLKAQSACNAFCKAIERCGEILAAIHRINAADVPFLINQDAAAHLAAHRRVIDHYGFRHPALELALKWLEQNLPRDERHTVVHGDFRMGNLIVGDHGIRVNFLN